ncbi:MAG: NERD domain-containing protein [Candidatus Lokiarchaeota archaeon]|nr:NERD domain-containing protein [Candidatus Lokiarchaeota archaeon]
MKGIEFEQEIYHKLKTYITDDKILVSTRIFTGKSPWGVEIDILFLDQIIGKVKRFHKDELWAIEIKNHEEKIDIEHIKKFYDDISGITKNLYFISKNGFTYEAYRLMRDLNMRNGTGSYLPFSDLF